MCPFLLGTLRTKKIRVFKGIELGINIFEIGIVEIKMAKYYLNPMSEKALGPIPQL